MLQFVIMISYKVPQGILKNLPHFKKKKKCDDKNASETFVEL